MFFRFLPWRFLRADLFELDVRLEAKFVRLVGDTPPDAIPSNGKVSTFFVTLAVSLLVVAVVTDGVVEPVQQPVQNVLDHHVGSVDVIEFVFGGVG